MDTSPTQPFNIVPTTVELHQDGTLSWHGVVPSKDYFHLPTYNDPPTTDFWVLKECPILNYRNQPWLLEGLKTGLPHTKDQEGRRAGELCEGECL